MYRRKQIAEKLRGSAEYPLDAHHNAAADGLSALKIVIEILKMNGCGSSAFLAQNPNNSHKSLFRTEAGGILSFCIETSRVSEISKSQVIRYRS